MVSGTVTDAPVVGCEPELGPTVKKVVNVDEPDVTVTALVVNPPVLVLPPLPSPGPPLVLEMECGSVVVGVGKCE